MPEGGNTALHDGKEIFARDKIDQMDVSQLRDMFCESQIFQIKLKMRNDKLRKALVQATENSHEHFKKLGGVIHDLRNIIGIISGIEEIFSRDQTLKPKQHEYLKALKMSADNLRELAACMQNEMPAQSTLMSSEKYSPVSLHSDKTKKYKILLVEDDPSNILIVSTFLENLGYQYDIASTGYEVLEKIKDSFYSLILMDIGIPDMDGITVTETLRRLEVKGFMPHTPVVAMTAHALVEDRQRCFDAGMDDYISKPFSQDQLRDKVEHNICFSHPVNRMVAEAIS